MDVIPNTPHWAEVWMLGIPVMAILAVAWTGFMGWSGEDLDETIVSLMFAAVALWPVVAALAAIVFTFHLAHGLGKSLRERVDERKELARRQAKPIPD